jgi:hypothetical protein
LTTTPLPVGSGGTGLTTLTTGYIPFGAGTSAFGNTANLFWDNTNARLGVGTATPSSNLEVSAASGATLKITNSTSSQTTNDLVGALDFISADNSSSQGGLPRGYIRTYIDGALGTGAYMTFATAAAGSGGITERMRIFVNGGVSIATTTDAGAGNLLMGTGNVTQGTAAKGFNFTANTPAAGMTTQLLNWYEEGTWTPNQGAGLTVVGAFSSTGRYTRIGRQVSISGTVTGATSVSVTAAGVITSNLPFTVVTAGHGGATNVANNASATVICTSTNVTSAAAIAATATITFSATYFV